MEIQQGVSSDTDVAIGGDVVGGTTGSILFVGPGPILAQDNANLFWDDTNNRLGIGTNVPLKKLHLFDNVLDPRIYIESNNTSLIPGLEMSFDNTQTRRTLIRTAATGSLGTELQFFTKPDSASAVTQRVVIDNTGNVGIGVTAPLGLLHLLRTGNAPTDLVFNNPNTGTQGSARIVVSGSSNNSTLAGIQNPALILSSYGSGVTLTGFGVTLTNYGQITTGATTAGLIIGTGNSSAKLTLGTNSLAALTVDTVQNVGIGVTSPVSLLNVGGNKSAASWTTVGLNLAVDQTTLTDTTGTGTITTRTANSFAAPVFAASNTETITHASTLYIAGAPAAGTNTTITNTWGLQTGAGIGARFGGSLAVGNGIGASAVAQIYSSNSAAFNTASMVYGGAFEVSNAGTGGATGFDGNAQVQNAGTVANAYGAIASVRIQNGGTITNGYALVGRVPLISSGTITNAYGLYAQGQKITGVTNGYGVYAAGTSDINYFAGNTGIGQTAPTAVLHLKAGTATTDTAPLKFTSGTINTIAVAGQHEYDGNHRITNVALLRYPLGGTLFDFFTDSTVGGAEADIYTNTLLANTFNANGDKIMASYSGNFVTVGTELTQLKVYFAGTAIWDSTGVAPTTGTTSWRVFVELIRVSSTVVRYSVSLTTTGASGFVYETTGELTGLTLSGTNILKITGTSSGVGSGSGDIIGKMGYVSFQPAA